MSDPVQQCCIVLSKRERGRKKEGEKGRRSGQRFFFGQFTLILFGAYDINLECGAEMHIITIDIMIFFLLLNRYEQLVFP